jgi:hypothetical protein
MRKHNDQGSMAMAMRRALPLTARLACCLVVSGISLAPASAQTIFAPSRATLPLSFGMTSDQASQSLGVPLFYVRGSTGNELLIAIPNVKGAALSSRSDGLYLQFRKGKLTGWKGDWGTIRP